MSEKVHPVPEEWAKRAYIDAAGYEALYGRSVADPDGFWGEIGKRLD
jgi:acetyl-CoA synthetase